MEYCFEHAFVRQVASAASLFGVFVILLVRCGLMVPSEYKPSLTVLATVGGLAAVMTMYSFAPLIVVNR